MAPRESPLSVYASKVGSDANVCPDKPKSKLTALMEKSDNQKEDQTLSIKTPSASPKPKQKKQMWTAEEK